MFGSIGGAEILLILTLALLLFGPRRLPQIGKTLGGALAELRRASREFKTGLEREVELDQVRAARDGLAAAGRELTDSVKGVARVESPAPAPAAEPPSNGAPTKPDGGNDPRAS
jgi:Tat protein translocase TatB subunit